VDRRLDLGGGRELPFGESGARVAAIRRSDAGLEVES
jgi:hypothetical protein